MYRRVASILLFVFVIVCHVELRQPLVIVTGHLCNALDERLCRSLLHITRGLVDKSQEREGAVLALAFGNVLRAPHAQIVLQSLLEPASFCVERTWKVQSAGVVHQHVRQPKLDQTSRGVWHVDVEALTHETSGIGVLACRQRTPNIGSLEQIRVVADLPELHDQVHQVCSIFILAVSRLLDEIENRDAIAELGIHGALAIGQVAVNIQLDLIAKFLLHMLLDTSKHERFQNHVQTAKLVFVELGVGLRMVFDILGKPFAELVVTVE